LAAALAMWAGPTALSDRWNPAMLTVTHLLTLGYMGMVMLGALMQVFPVVIGHPFRFAPWVSRVVHAGLTFGVLLLAGGFLWPSLGLMPAALLVLALSVAVFLITAVSTLVQVEAWGDTARAIALALSAFAATAGLGVWLALGHTGITGLQRHWTDLHALWGLAGWVPLLLMGVAFQVVPMFQITPEYPRFVRRGFPVALFALLLVSTLLHGVGSSGITAVVCQAAGGLILAGFAATTLLLQQRRRRTRPDVTVAYWRTGLICLLLAVILWTAGRIHADLRVDARFASSLGILMIPGFALSVINGMLYKIVPFLVWLHLAMAPAEPDRKPAGKAPGMKRIIPEQHAWWQWRAHVLGLAVLGAAAIGVPGALQTGALILAIAFARLGLDILHAIRVYAGHLALERTTKRAARPERQ
jgi:uncharacterized protein (TIGR03382 family)